MMLYKTIKLSNIFKKKPVCTCFYCDEGVMEIGEFPCDGYVLRTCTNCGKDFAIQCYWPSVDSVASFRGISMEAYDSNMKARAVSAEAERLRRAFEPYITWMQQCKDEHEWENVMGYLADAMSNAIDKNYN